MAKAKPVEIQRKLDEAEFISDFEKGLISDSHFRGKICECLDIQSDNETIDDAWNAMLLDIPPTRIDLLKSLATQYRTFILSNTNSIHMRKFETILKDATGIHSLDEVCNKVYLSHQVHQRKPEAIIYQTILTENNLNANQTLFLDDSLINLEGAGKVGIHTFHVQHPDMIFSLFS